jgi:hypothetical protein
MSKFGKVLDLDASFIGNEVKPENLLVYMGMIEQTVTEMLLSSGMSSNTPAKSV